MHKVPHKPYWLVSPLGGTLINNYYYYYYYSSIEKAEGIVDSFIMT
jgi:hypothetical protein